MNCSDPQRSSSLFDDLFDFKPRLVLFGPSCLASQASAGAFGRKNEGIAHESSFRYLAQPCLF